MAHPQDLQALHEQIWQELAQAARDRSHAWRTLVLATHHPDDGTQARTVILREVEAYRQELVIYTDARAGKAREIAAEPRASLVMWWPERGWQLRIKARLELHTQGLAVTSRWATLQHHRAAQDYLAPLAPGQTLPAGGHAQPAAGERLHHFAVIIAQVHSLDWLGLSPGGHARAVFDAQGPRWVQP